jgi:hypothetical protein
MVAGLAVTPHTPSTTNRVNSPSVIIRRLKSSLKLRKLLRAACGGGPGTRPGPVLTVAVRGATLIADRDEERFPSVEQRNGTRCRTFLQNFPHATQACVAGNCV